MDDEASNIFSHSVVSDMFSGDNFTQHYGGIQATFSSQFSFPLSSEAHKGMKEGGTRDKMSVIVTMFFIHNLKFSIISS